MNAYLTDILQLTELQTFQVVAGAEGLNNSVLHVSYIDHTHALLDVVPAYDLPGTLYLTNLSNSYQNEQDLLKLFNHLILSKSSGLIIDNFYLQTLPQSVINLCNAKKLPVIFQQQNQISYASIIYAIMHYMLVLQEEAFLSSEIRSLLTMTGPPEMISERVKMLFPGLCRYYSVICSHPKSPERTYSPAFSMPKNCFTCKYSSSLLYILSAESNDKLKSLVRFVLQQLENQSDVNGVSTIFDQSKYMALCLREAIAACDMCKKMSSSCIYYQELGLFSFLIPLKDDIYLRKFCEKTLSSIKAYDMQYHTNYLTSLIKFVEAGGSYSKAAADMSLHENSVRYRINRIRESFFPGQSNLDFYTNIAIACRLESLLSK